MIFYILKRLALIPITLWGITFIVFGITRMVPGGPFELSLMQIQAQSMQYASHQTALSDEQVMQLKTYYGLDQPWYIAYFQWMGKVLRGDLGESQRYQDPVWDMIIERLPISLTYGLIALCLTYGLCIPLGIFKAIYPNSLFDKMTSGLVFLGYAVPNYVLGSLMLIIFCVYADLLPLGGFVSDDFNTLSLGHKLKDIALHSILPLSCYVIGSFAFITTLMRNSLLDQLGADFMRTAIARGLSFKQAVIQHALPNALLALAADFGQNLTLVLSGSFIIETLFDIDGFGLLGYTSIMSRDYPVVMGILLLSAFLYLLGNLCSDLLVAALDPRIQFNKSRLS